nr:MAG TPA: hypothetical protein [Caudoviricetes sp.]
MTGRNRLLFNIVFLTVYNLYGFLIVRALKT